LYTILQLAGPILGRIAEELETFQGGEGAVRRDVYMAIFEASTQYSRVRVGSASRDV
jgi:hypothetical protein